MSLDWDEINRCPCGCGISMDAPEYARLHGDNPPYPKGWRCPECGSEVLALANGFFHPVTCSWGHAPKEMEQFVAEDPPA